ncbi:hypothetical protein HPB52_017076 [Rhipicephalus sanguineus]|uniref:DDE Tnp4 domain-containing protein n=1 Tax=Rhipicephalus sanguineus TaxID=34632 RepID=A0A9D4YQJ3_RHISA|nr:hypothetical protein HPB52_017076 [Rhipicephalus sanguineus]
MTTQGSQKVDALQQSAAKGRNNDEDKPTASPTKATIKCGYCGTKHAKGSCPAYGKKCKKCNKVGHFAMVCRTGTRQQRRVNAVEHSNSHDEVFISVIQNKNSAEEEWHETITFACGKSRVQVLDKHVEDDLYMGLGCIKCFVYDADLKEDASKLEIRPPRKVPYALMDNVKTEVDSMEKAGIIKRVNEPIPVCSQMVVIKQKGKLRICIDPTDLNKILLRRHFLLKKLEKIAAQTRWFEETVPLLGEKFFKRAFRVTPGIFRYIVDTVRPLLERQNTNMREAIALDTRVAIGLYRLCSSAEERSIAEFFAVGRATVNEAYKELCEAVIETMENNLILLALVDYRYRLRYINVGSPGRCHDSYVYQLSLLEDAVQGPLFRRPLLTISGTAVPPLILCDQAFPLTANLTTPFCHRAHSFSVVPMAIVESSCKYVLIDVGAESRLSDGGTFKNAEFGRAVTQETMDIPLVNAPCAFVGDEAFQLREDFVRPYPARQLDDEKRVFNYRQSRARRYAENAFGITAAKWRISLRTISLHPDNVDYVIKAACVLHNFLSTHNPETHTFADTEDSSRNVVPGQWRESVEAASGDSSDPYFFPLKATRSRSYSKDAAAARDFFAQ